MAAHMGTLALKLGRRIKWDHASNFFANVSGEEIMQVFRGWSYYSERISSIRILNSFTNVS